MSRFGLTETTGRLLEVMPIESTVDLADHASRIAGIAHRSRRDGLQPDRLLTVARRQALRLPEPSRDDVMFAFVALVKANLDQANAGARELAGEYRQPKKSTPALTPRDLLLPPEALLRLTRRLALQCVGCGNPRVDDTPGCPNCHDRVVARARRAKGAACS